MRLPALWPRRLGVQLPLMMVLALCLAIGGFGAYTARQQSAAALLDIEQGAATLARNIALTGQNAVLTDQLDVIEQLLLRSLDFPGVRDVAVLDAAGAQLSRAVHEPGQPPRALIGKPGERLVLPTSPEAHTLRLLDTGRVTAWHPIVAGSVAGWVRVDRDTEALQALRRQALRNTVAACLLAGAASTMLMVLWLRLPLRQIERARDFAIGLEHIRGQQLFAERGPAETRALGRALNQASARLLAQHRAIESGTAAVADSNERLGTIFALSPDALLSFDAQGQLKYANAAFERITGIPLAEVLRQHASVLEARLRARCAPGDADFALEACFAPNEAAAGPLPRQRLTLLGPQPTVVELAGMDSASTSVTRLLHLRDVTRESEVERLKSEFLSTAAHELRTPITTLYGCTELLAMGDFGADKRQQMYAMMKRQGDVLLSLVNALLDLSRIEAKRGADVHIETLALPALVQRGAAEFRSPEGREPPQCAAPPALLQVLADAPKLQQVLRNLLSNAYKYSATGAVEVRWLLAGEDPAADAAHCGFEVRDHGIGMTATEVARVGERFYRADASGHVPGTGLGMSIVGELLKAMGGRLRIHSEPGVGTRVQVWLRCAGAPTAAAPAKLERQAV